MTPPELTPKQEKDQVINVTLSKEDYEVMRDIIEKQKSLNWLGRWFRTVAFITVGGLVSLFILGDHIREFFTWLVKAMTITGNS